MMMKHIQQVQTIEEWDLLKQDIPAYGLLLFKFSPRCPISRRVERKFDDWFEGLAEEAALHCAKVDVVNTRQLSQHIAQELQVEHESPQVIWIAPDRRIHWHESHYTITPEALTTQFNQMG